jgi:hypothetical protein
VGSTTTPFKTTNTALQQQQQLVSKKAIECIPSQEESAEADYDLGVLGCSTAGQICVASDNSTVGGYCMDPPITDDMGRRRFLVFSDALSCAKNQDVCSCQEYEDSKCCIWVNPVN